MNFNNLPIDANGIPFEKHSFWLNPKEYSKIYSEINTNNYNIFMRIVDTH